MSDQTHVVIDEKLRKRANELGINISGVARRALVKEISRIEAEINEVKKT